MIEFEGASFGYGERPLLRDMTLALAPGSFHFLTGPSGAGKSTFISLCHGELRPHGGHVRVFGRDLAAMGRDEIARMRRRIGIVHQNCQFLDHLSVEENVALPLIVAGRAREAAELRELLAWVGLAAQRDALPPSLSGGERQRAALARAVITAPELLLADEPTGNLDWEMSLKLLTLLVELNRLGTTVLVATHDLNLIRSAKAQVAARVLRISGGRVQIAGSEL